MTVSKSISLESGGKTLIFSAVPSENRVRVSFNAESSMTITANEFKEFLSLLNTLKIQVSTTSQAS